MKQPQRPGRLERAVNKLEKYYDSDDAECLNALVDPADVLKLLHRERARLRRKVRKLRTQKINSLYGWHSEGYIKALDLVERMMEE